ncbi:hypothetical protein Dimus_005549 [Dionaea muscipula]
MVAPSSRPEAVRPLTTVKKSWYPERHRPPPCDSSSPHRNLDHHAGARPTTPVATGHGKKRDNDREPPSLVSKLITTLGIPSWNPGPRPSIDGERKEARMNGKWNDERRKNARMKRILENGNRRDGNR